MFSNQEKATGENGFPTENVLHVKRASVTSLVVGTVK